MKIALGIEYNGANYHGWQRQKSARSVQEYVEHALSKIADEPINIFCAGRTDAKVHATGQVVHFETTKNRSMAAWTMGVNANIPNDISITWAIPVSDDFHARFSATARSYRYIIYNAPIRPAILSERVTHIYTALDAEKMDEAAQCLVGYHDFSSFRASQCQSHSPWRTIHYLTITRQNEYIILEVKANAFLHHMVRNIVGSLLKVGSGIETKAWMNHLLEACDRTQAGMTAKPDGLYLIGVDYPESFGILKPVNLFI